MGPCGVKPAPAGMFLNHPLTIAVAPQESQYATPESLKPLWMSAYGNSWRQCSQMPVGSTCGDVDPGILSPRDDRLYPRAFRRENLNRPAQPKLSGDGAQKVFDGGRWLGQ